MELGIDREPLSFNNLEGPSQPPYILSRTITLTGQQEKKVQEEVQAIQSELTIYVAVMSKSNAGGKYFGLIRHAVCFNITSRQESNSDASAGGQDGLAHHIVRQWSHCEDDYRRLATICLRQSPAAGRYLPLRAGKEEEHKKD